MPRNAVEKKRAKKNDITAVKIGLLVIKLIVLLIPMLVPALAVNQLTLYTPNRVETVKVPISVCKETVVSNKYGFVHIGITWKVHHLEQAVLVTTCCKQNRHSCCQTGLPTLESTVSHAPG